MTVYFSQPCSRGSEQQLPLFRARIKYPCIRAGQRYMQEEISAVPRLGAPISLPGWRWDFCPNSLHGWCRPCTTPGAAANTVLEPWPTQSCFPFIASLRSQKHRLLFHGDGYGGSAGKDRQEGRVLSTLNSHPSCTTSFQHFHPLLGRFWVIPP